MSFAAPLPTCPTASGRGSGREREGESSDRRNTRVINEGCCWTGLTATAEVARSPHLPVLWPVCSSHVFAWCWLADPPLRCRDLHLRVGAGERPAVDAVVTQATQDPGIVQACWHGVHVARRQTDRPSVRRCRISGWRGDALANFRTCHVEEDDAHGADQRGGVSEAPQVGQPEHQVQHVRQDPRGGDAERGEEEPPRHALDPPRA